MPNQIELPPLIITPSPPPPPPPITLPGHIAQPLPWSERFSGLSSMAELGKKINIRHPRASIAIYVLTRTTANAIDNDYSTNLQQLFAATEDEINLVVGSAALPLIEKMTRRRAAIGMLINSKSDELHRSNEVANAFYGSSPLNRNPVDFVNAFFPRIRSKSPDEVFKAWIEFYSAAHGVTLLTATIRILNEKAASLDAEIEVARAQQAIAAAEARRHAEEQAQLAAQAEADARRRAEEQAHLAAQAEAEARRRTEEQAQLAAQAEAEARRLSS